MHSAVAQYRHRFSLHLFFYGKECHSELGLYSVAVWDVFRVISEVQIDNDMFFFCSGVSVNVQDLAPSCAGALFGKF